MTAGGKEKISLSTAFVHFSDGVGSQKQRCLRLQLQIEAKE